MCCSRDRGVRKKGRAALCGKSKRSHANQRDLGSKAVPENEFLSSAVGFLCSVGNWTRPLVRSLLYTDAVIHCLPMSLFSKVLLHDSPWLQVSWPHSWSSLFVLVSAISCTIPTSYLLSDPTWNYCDHINMLCFFCIKTSLTLCLTLLTFICSNPACLSRAAISEDHKITNTSMQYKFLI